MPISSATPTAASAFCTLCRPGIGSSIPSIRRVAIALRMHIEAVAAGDRLHMLAANVGLRRKAIGHDAPIADARHDRLHLGMIDAQHRAP
jgi:hypothetical protein